MRTLRYTVIFDPQPDGGFVVTVPALPGCVTEGDTLREARRMASEVIKAYCASLLKEGRSPPEDVRSVPVHERMEVILATA
jgi:predicted RNase H-like HicB family nuclease